MNLSQRFKNKTFVVSFVALVISFIYSALRLFGVEIPVSENEIFDLCSMAITIIAMLGVFTNPTTPGILDKKENE